MSKLFQDNRWKYAAALAILAAGGCGSYYAYFHKGNRRKGQGGQDNNNRQKTKEELKNGEDKSLKDEGNGFFKAGKYAEALEKYTEAIEQTEDVSKLQLLYQNRAAVYEKLGDMVSVIRESSSALDLNGKYVKALHRRSKGYKALGFLEEALEDITAVCILEQFNVASSVQLADDILKELGAQQGLLLMKEKVPRVPAFHNVLAYTRGFKYCPVARALIHGNEQNSKALDDLYSTLKGKEIQKTIDLCDERLEKNVCHETFHLRGTLRFLCGYGDETVSDFNAAMETEDKELRATCLIKRASYYALIDDQEKCSESFDLAQKGFPDNVDLWHHQGQVLLSKGDMEGALSCMRKSVECCGGDFAVAVATKAYVEYRMSGGGHESMRLFQKLVKKFPTSPDVHSLYGQILMEKGLFEEAELTFGKVAELDPENGSVVVHRAMCTFQRTGDPKLAIQILNNTKCLDNEFVLETLGTLHLQIGDLDKAIEYISKAQTLARSLQELTILSSLRKAAEVQKKVKDKLGLQAPSFIDK